MTTAELLTVAYIFAVLLSAGPLVKLTYAYEDGRWGEALAALAFVWPVLFLVVAVVYAVHGRQGLWNVWFNLWRPWEMAPLCMCGRFKEDRSYQWVCANCSTARRAYEQARRVELARVVQRHNAEHDIDLPRCLRKEGSEG